MNRLTLLILTTALCLGCHENDLATPVCESSSERRVPLDEPNDVGTPQSLVDELVLRTAELAIRSPVASDRAERILFEPDHAEELQLTGVAMTPTSATCTPGPAQRVYGELKVHFESGLVLRTDTVNGLSYLTSTGESLDGAWLSSATLRAEQAYAALPQQYQELLTENCPAGSSDPGLRAFIGWAPFTDEALIDAELPVGLDSPGCSSATGTLTWL